MKYIVKELFYEVKYIFQFIKGIKYKKEIDKINILNDEETINEIVNKHKSISRFGDGELRWILMTDDTPEFQNKSIKLKERLIEVISSNKENLLVCLPKSINDLKEKKATTKWFWMQFINLYWEKLKEYICIDKTYGNTGISRFYIAYKNKKNTIYKIENLKKIWENKKIFIIEGEQTKLGVNNDLFDNASRIRRIVCPSTNAFDKYEEILNSTKKYLEKDEIVMIALGPTATILSYDLSELGYQAIDIGHIDIEYEWFKMSSKEKVSIVGKYVNEAVDGNVLKDINIVNEKYNSEIILKIK